MAVVLITHDLGVVAEVTDQIVVMYAGRIVEAASTEEIFRAPEHPYTWGLLQSIPRLDQPRDEPLVPIAGLPPSLINASQRLLVPSPLPVRARAPPPRRARSWSRCPTTPPTRSPACSTARRASGSGATCAPAWTRSRRARRSGSRRSRHERRRPLVEVRDLVKHFPLTRGIVFQQTGRRGARRRRRVLRRAAWRDARDRRRDRMRQDDHGAPDHAAARADERHDPVRGRRRHAPAPTRAEAAAARDADDLPGPLLVAQPAQDGRRDHRRRRSRSTAWRRAGSSAGARCRS